MLSGYLRSDGRKGIRNILVVGYLVECAHHVAREITLSFRDQDVHLIGFPGCYPNEYAQKMMAALCTHPNVGAALLVSLGCESFDKHRLEKAIKETGRPVQTLVIQGVGGTRKTIEAGKTFVATALQALSEQKRVPMDLNELVVGTVCGGSDGTSGITGNPFDIYPDAGIAISAKPVATTEAEAPIAPGAELEETPNAKPKPGHATAIGEVREQSLSVTQK